MIKADLYSFEGKKKESINLPKEYDVKPNLSLLSQAVHVYEDRNHLGLARAKTRSEVAISTRKIYRQKGTGGARHGAKSAPIFVGGGVAHGPKGIKRILRLSKSQKYAAFLSAIQSKVKDGSFVVVDGMDKISKTKNAFNLIKKLVENNNWKEKGIITFALSKKNGKAKIAFRNIKGVSVDDFSSLNAYKVFSAKRLIVDKEAFTEKKDIVVERSNEVKVKSGKKAEGKIPAKKAGSRRTIKSEKAASKKAGKSKK